MAKQITNPAPDFRGVYVIPLNAETETEEDIHSHKGPSFDLADILSQLSISGAGGEAGSNPFGSPLIVCPPSRGIDKFGLVDMR